MNAKAFKTLVKLSILNGWPLLAEGSPGIGKSEIIIQAIHEINNDVSNALSKRVNAGEITQAVASAEYERQKTVYCILHPVVSDPTDFKGLPGFVNGQAEFSPFGDLRAMIDAKNRFVVIIDDLGQGSQATQAALMQLVLAREVNGVKISDKVTFIAATNRRADNAGVSGLITPLRSRFRSTVELVPDAKEVASYLLSKGAPIELCAFLNLRPAMVNTFDQKTAREGKPFACPRTISFLADFLNAGIDCPETLAGCVGETFAIEFLGFRSMFKAIGNLPAQILTNPQTAPIPQEIDRLFAIAAALTYHASVKNIDALATYFDRFDDNAEFRTFFWKTVTARKPEIAQTNAHSTWFVKHGANDVC